MEPLHQTKRVPAVVHLLLAGVGREGAVAEANYAAALALGGEALLGEQRLGGAEQVLPGVSGGRAATGLDRQALAEASRGPLDARRRGGAGAGEGVSEHAGAQFVVSLRQGDAELPGGAVVQLRRPAGAGAAAFGQAAVARLQQAGADQLIEVERRERAGDLDRARRFVAPDVRRSPHHVEVEATADGVRENRDAGDLVDQLLRAHRKKQVARPGVYDRDAVRGCNEYADCA